MGNINTSIGNTSLQNNVSDTSLSLVTFGFIQAQVDRASRCLIFVNTNSIRVDWSESTSLTTSNGAIINNVLELSGNQNLSQFRMIRNGSLDSEIFIMLEV